MKTPHPSTITQGPILPALLQYYFPIVLGTFFQMLYNTADAIIVGRFVGKEALGAVGGSTGTLVSLFIGFFAGLGSGASVVISQQYGARNREGIFRSVHATVALAITSGLLLTVIGVGFAQTMSTLIGAEGLLHRYCVQYLRIYFSGTVFVLIYNLGTGILRAIGDSRRPLSYLVVCCFVNILLDLLLVGVLKMEVAGAALATILSQTVSALLVLAALIRSRDAIRLFPRKIRFYGRELTQICRIGLPSGLQSTMYAISNVLIQSSINRFSTDVIAAWSAFARVDTFFWMALGALGTSVCTFIGQNYGAGNPDRIRRCVRLGLALGAGLSVVLSIVMHCFGYNLLSLFSRDTSVLQTGLEIVRFLTPWYVAFVCIEILAASLRGMGDSLIPMLLTCGGVCGMRVCWLLLSGKLWPGRLLVMLSCYPLTWVATSTLFVVYYISFTKRRGIPL